MKKIKHILLLFFVCCTLGGCEKALMGNDADSDAVAVFEYLWERVDEQYAFFDVKHVDWQAVHDSLRPQVYEGMRQDKLFNIMAKMLNTLQDGHVNLTSPFDVSRNDSVYYRMYANSNVDWNVVMTHYLKTDYHTTGSLLHNVLRDSTVIYVRYSSFSNVIHPSHFNYVVTKYPKAKGLILDLRQNGGGNVDNIWLLLKLMPNHGQKLYTTHIKTGPGHEDFGPLQTVYAHNDCGSYKAYTNPVVVLVDRGSFSATSTFAICTQGFDNMILMGDTTGGGLGLPNGGELPNRWRYRFSITRTYALDGKNYENGVPPDKRVLLNKDSVALGYDNVIERACDWIISN